MNIVEENAEPDNYSNPKKLPRIEQTMLKARQTALRLGLDMKIGDVEYQGDKTKAIFYYIADEDSWNSLDLYWDDMNSSITDDT